MESYGWIIGLCAVWSVCVCADRWAEYKPNKHTGMHAQAHDHGTPVGSAARVCHLQEYKQVRDTGALGNRRAQMGAGAGGVEREREKERAPHARQPSTSATVCAYTHRRTGFASERAQPKTAHGCGDGPHTPHKELGGRIGGISYPALTLADGVERLFD